MAATRSTKIQRGLLLLTAGAALALTGVPTLAQGGQPANPPPARPDPAAHAAHVAQDPAAHAGAPATQPGTPSAQRAEPYADLLDQIAQLRAQVAQLQGALAQGHTGTPMQPGGAARQGPMGGTGTGMSGMDQPMMAMMQQMMGKMDQMMSGMGMGGASGAAAAGAGMPGGMMDDMDMMGMGGASGAGAGAGGMPGGMMDDTDMMGMGGAGMGGMNGMPMMDQMMSMGMSRMGGGMNTGSMLSALPGFPGASHIYHLGATGFFLDHATHITLSVEQQQQLNEIKEQSLLDQATFQRSIEQAEQDLWNLTAADSPDAAKVEAKAREIAQLQADQRIAFIRDVGKAAGILTSDQRMQLTGMVAPNPAPQPAGPGGMSGM